MNIHKSNKVDHSTDDVAQRREITFEVMPLQVDKSVLENIKLTEMSRLQQQRLANS